jgi:hypothetical protein
MTMPASGRSDRPWQDRDRVSTVGIFNNNKKTLQFDTHIKFAGIYKS